MSSNTITYSFESRLNKDKSRFLSLYDLEPDDTGCLQLKNLKDITDEEIMVVCKMAHNLPITRTTNFIIKRSEEHIHCTYIDGTINLHQHTCLNFGYATINANWHFQETEKDKGESFKINIGEIHYSSSRVMGYIQIVDYLRENNYLIPFKNYPIKEILKNGWALI